MKRTFAVGPECSLAIDTYRGGIVVEEIDEPEIRVTVRMQNDLDDEGESNRVLDAVQLEMNPGQNGVTIRVRNPAASAPHLTWRDRALVEVALLVSVPRQCSVNLTTVTGSIQVGNLTGAMRARAGTGTVSFRHIDGSVNAAVTTGDVLVARCSGAVTVVASRGNIRLGVAGGPADLTASNGDIEIQNAKAGLRAVATAGDVIAGLAPGFTGDADVRTAAGTIVVKLDPAEGYSVQASSVWGRVESKLPMAVSAGASGKSKLSGQINGGGPRLKLHANGGHIKIDRALPAE
ncbi:MAG TPA: DUF4097 family beta strand repeat-containing protein [Opitutaceae bacterium]|nr:DUF4097 family beta strand repeat-containing protein [Opitutaceae bacterium]